MAAFSSHSVEDISIQIRHAIRDAKMQTVKHSANTMVSMNVDAIVQHQKPTHGLFMLHGLHLTCQKALARSEYTETRHLHLRAIIGTKGVQQWTLEKVPTILC